LFDRDRVVRCGLRRRQKGVAEAGAGESAEVEEKSKAAYNPYGADMTQTIEC
jgi:hypothetical protein